MHARIQAARENESGFTLIELLIVIVILGVLAGVVVFSVSGITSRGEVAACKSDKKNVEVASEAYFAQTGHYALATPRTTGTPAVTTTNAINTLITANLLRSAPPATELITLTAATSAGTPPVFTGGGAVASGYTGCS